MLYYARSKEYSSRRPPIGKKNAKRRKKRGLIVTARRNQNLITSVLVYGIANL